MTEMPFPIGANVASTVRIKDSSGNDINAVGGKVGVIDIDSLATKLDNLLTELNAKLETSDLSFTSGKVGIALFSGGGSAINSVSNNIQTDITSIGGGTSIGHTSGKQHIADWYQHGSLIFEQGQATSTTTIYTTSSGKRAILTFAVLSLSGSSAEWNLAFGSALQDKIVNATDTTFKYLYGQPICLGGTDNISVQEVSGSVTCRYLVTGIEYAV